MSPHTMIFKWYKIVVVFLSTVNIMKFYILVGES